MSVKVLLSSVILFASASRAQEIETPLDLPPATDDVTASADTDAAKDGAAKDGAAKDDAAKDDAAKDGAAKDDAAKDEAAKDDAGDVAKDIMDDDDEELAPDDAFGIDYPLLDPDTREKEAPPKSHRSEKSDGVPLSPYGGGDDNSDDVAPAPDDVKGGTTLSATVVPGLIGLAAGAALPVTLLGTGSVGLFLALNNGGGGAGDTCALGLLSIGCIGLGAVAIGPLSTVTAASGSLIGALTTDRSIVPSLAGLGAGVIVIGIAIVSYAGSSAVSNQLAQLGDTAVWVALGIPTAILTLAGPVTVGVATLVDLFFFSEPPDAPGRTLDSLRRREFHDVVTDETSVAMPFRY